MPRRRSLFQPRLISVKKLNLTFIAERLAALTANRKNEVADGRIYQSQNVWSACATETSWPSMS
jgi:hypothetical protein